MSRTSWRVLRTEMLRGAAPVAALAVAVSGIAVMFSDPSAWAGQWKPLADEFRSQLATLMAFATAAAAWQAGRERRRKAAEQARSAARPSAHSALMTWASVALGVFAGGLTMWLAGVAVVAPVATYSGRGWVLTMLVGLIALATASALGVTVGWLVPYRLAAPIAGGVIYIALEMLMGGPAPLSVLTPNALYPESFTYVPAAFSFRQALWLLAIAVTALALVGAARRWLVVIPAAAIVGITVTTASGDPYYGPRLPDDAAMELVCADGTPEVCLTRANAFLLDDITPLVREQLERWEGVPGGFERAVDSGHYDWDDEPPAFDSTAKISVDFTVSWRGDLQPRDKQFGGSWVESIVARSLDNGWGYQCSAHWTEDAEIALGVAQIWAGGGTWDHFGAAEFDRLNALAANEQRAWMGRFMTASRECDEAAYSDLIEELR